MVQDFRGVLVGWLISTRFSSRLAVFARTRRNGCAARPRMKNVAAYFAALPVRPGFYELAPRSLERAIASELSLILLPGNYLNSLIIVLLHS